MIENLTPAVSCFVTILFPLFLLGHTPSPSQMIVNVAAQVSCVVPDRTCVRGHLQLRPGVGCGFDERSCQCRSTQRESHSVIVGLCGKSVSSLCKP